jgi:hypothetical protein
MIRRILGAALALISGLGLAQAQAQAPGQAQPQALRPDQVRFREI